MKKFRRLLGLVLSLAVAAGMLTACAGSAGNSGGPEASSKAGESAAPSGKATELTLWLPPYATEGEALDQQWWTETLAPWAQENNVNLSIEITPWAKYEEKYLTAFSSGAGPDVGYMYLEMYNDFIDMGTLEPLEAYFSKEDTANYLYYDKGFVKGKQYTLPFIVGNARILYFNMDILNQAGVTELPSTWDELVEVCTKVKNANIEGVIPYGQGWADPAIGALNILYYPYLWQAGGDIFDKDGKVALLNNDAAVRSAQYNYDLRYKFGVVPEECLAMTGDDVLEQFAAGKVAVQCGATNRAKVYDEAGLNWDYVASLEDKQKAIWIAADSLIMNAASGNKEMAAKLMKHITSTEIMEKFHAEVSAFPPISKDEKFLDNPKFEKIYENPSILHTMPVAPNSFKVMDTLYKNLQLMMLGDLTPEQAVQQTVDYASSLG